MKVVGERQLQRQLWEVRYSWGQLLGVIEDEMKVWGRRVREIPCYILGHKWRGWVARDNRGARGYLMCTRCGRKERAWRKK